MQSVPAGVLVSREVDQMEDVDECPQGDDELLS